MVQYLAVKQQLLLAYCTNVVFYMLLKAEGKSVRAHPVMKQLLELRYALEKLRAIDGKLKYQIDRLLKQATSEETEELPSTSSRPNPRALLDDHDEDDDAAEVPEKAAKGVYKAPRLAAMPYKDDESEREKRAEKLDRKKKKLRNSEMFEALREEFGTTPELSSSTGISTVTGDQRQLQAEADERREFEEDRFVRLTLSRKDKKSLKRREQEASRLDTVNNMGDFGDFEELNDIVAMASEPVAPSRGSGIAAQASLEKAMRTMQQAAGGHEEDDDDAYGFADLLAAGPEKKRARRPAPDAFIDEEGVAEEGILEAFSKKKKEFQSLKAEHYSAAPKFGGIEESVEGGAKRAASYEIMKNKGLTPHRKKANRNPRVKKREAYDKAVIRRKGQVRDVISGAGEGYGGELTGIKANIARSRKIGS